MSQPSSGAPPATVADSASATTESVVTSLEAVEPGVLFVALLAVRWRDLDALHHVNNASYLTFLEESRLQWLNQLSAPWYDANAAPVLVASEINYRQPIAWPAQLRIELRCARLGHSSLSLAHRMLDVQDNTRLYSDGTVVLVWMNPQTGKSVPLPAVIRQVVAAVTPI